MRLNVKHVEYFRMVMTVGTVTAAAEMLNTSQPSISRSMQQLEDAIGFQLFDRVRGRLVPTACAESLYVEIKKTFLGLDHITRFAGNLRTMQSGNISIVCAPVFAHDFIAEAATQFMLQHKFVKISIEIQRSETIADWLSAQRFDIGLVAGPMSPPGALSEIFAEPDEVCVLPAGHRLAGQAVISPQDLETDDFIYLESNSPYRYRLDRLFDDASVERSLVIETANSSSACSMVAKGAGVGIVNPFSAVEFVDRGLIMRPFSPSLPFTTTLLRAKHRPNSALIDRFVEELRRTRDIYLQRTADYCQCSYA